MFYYTIVVGSILGILKSLGILDLENVFWISLIILSARIDYLYSMQLKTIEVLAGKNDLDSLK